MVARDVQPPLAVIRVDDEIRPCPHCGFKLWPKGNVRTIRFHDLRHTYASVLLMSGAALVSVQRLLGHSDPKITERRYGHLCRTSWLPR
jgi:hypothetical protein